MSLWEFTLSGDDSAVLILTWDLASRLFFFFLTEGCQWCPQGPAGLKTSWKEKEGSLLQTSVSPPASVPLPSAPCRVVFSGNQQIRSQVVFSFLTLSHKESFITCGLKLAANCKEMAQRLQFSLCTGSRDARQWLCQRGLFSADCQRKEARRKREREEVAQAWWDHALHLFFPLICSVSIQALPPLAELLRLLHKPSQIPLWSLGVWCSPLPSSFRELGCLWIHLQVSLVFCFPVWWLSNQILTGERLINPSVLHYMRLIHNTSPWKLLGFLIGWWC